MFETFLLREYTMFLRRKETVSLNYSSMVSGFQARGQGRISPCFTLRLLVHTDLGLGGMPSISKTELGRYKRLSEQPGW